MTPRERKGDVGLWQVSVGFLPHKVTAYENAEKDGVLYLRWRAGGNWKKRSLGTKLRDERGRILAHVREMAEREAETQYEILSGRRAAATVAAAPLTIAQTWAIVSDAKTGLYPTDTAHRREVKRALEDAARIWGAATPWDVVDRARIRMLGRTRIDEIRRRKPKDGAPRPAGYRGAVVCLSRILGVAAWLRDEGRIASDACLPPRKWRDELKGYWQQIAGAGETLEPKQPRYTLEEMRRLHAVAAAVDPRFALLVAFGAELRLGQVARARRSDLSVEHRTLTVRGSGKKRGTVVELTGGQWAAWERAIAEGGYLERLDRELADYPLFPSGQLPGGRSGRGVADPARHGQAAPIDRTAIRCWLALAETAAKIDHMPGRGWYGLRRIAVDAGLDEGIPLDELMAMGGWTDPQIPLRIYRDRDAERARGGAAKTRAKIRGESDG